MDIVIKYSLWTGFRAIVYVNCIPIILTDKLYSSYVSETVHAQLMTMLTNALLKRWDSSDPERAPPPLPLNPGSSSPGITTKAGTSENIRAAAAALSERARESAGISAYTSNAMTPSREASPTKSLIREHHHKRFQSMQSNTLPAIRDVSNVSEQRQPRSLDRSPDKSAATRAQTPSHESKNINRDNQSGYQARGYRPILSGENTPPVSSTMLALRNTPEPSMDRPLPTPKPNMDVVRMPPQQVEGLSSQLLSLMTICTNLHQEMAQLSRRSKDNAQDLVVLKDATNARDEDIRQSLRNLVNNVTSGFERQRMETVSPSPTKMIRGNEDISSSPRAGSKSVSLPRIPTPNSFAALTDLAMPCRETGSKPFAVDGPTNIALLEKIMRDMGTKRGQEHALNLLNDLSEKVEAVKTSANSMPTRRGSIHNQYDGDYHSDHAGDLSRSAYPTLSILSASTEAQKPFASPRAADFVGSDMVKLLKKIKDSVNDNGDHTTEVKAMLQDLRTEIIKQAEATPSTDGTAELKTMLQDLRVEIMSHAESTPSSDGTTEEVSSIEASHINETSDEALEHTLLDRLDALEADMQKEVRQVSSDIQSSLPSMQPDMDEIMTALKAGFAEIRAEVDRLVTQSKEEEHTVKGAEVIMAPELPHPDSAQKDDIKKLEVLITTLRIKIEAMETSVVQPMLPEDTVRRCDLEVLETSIKHMAESMADIERQPRSDVGNSTLEAIEIMLSNTKAKVDDMAQNDDDRKAEFAEMHKGIDQCTSALEDLASKADASASVKEDVSVLESLIRELKSGMLESVEQRVSDDEKVTKANIEAIETLIGNTKAKLDELQLPAAETLGTKADIHALTAIVKEAHLKAASDAAATMMAFEEYKTTNDTMAGEAANSQAAVKEVKEYMESEVSSKLSEAASTMDALGNLMEKVEAKIAAPDMGPELAEIIATVKIEVERSNGMIEELRNLGEENRNITATLMDEFTQKAGEHHEHVALKLDEMHESGREREAHREASVEELKGTAGDLKIMVDGLGSTLTAAVDKIQEDSRTVFEKVDRSYVDHKNEHELTRSHIQRSVPVIDSMHEKISTHQPLVIEALRDIKELVAQHQSNLQEFRSEAATTREPLLADVPGSGESQPAIESTQPLLKDVAEKYDDAAVQHKLDQLLEHAQSSTASMSNDGSERGNEDAIGPSVDLLNQIHESFVGLATDFAAWTATHRDREAEAINTREKELAEAEISLTRAQVEREAVETQIRDMREDHEGLRKNVETLRYETEDLHREKVRAARELAGVETALEMRRAEMQDLEDRATQLERRVLEGLIDQSRVLLMTKNANRRVPAPRVPSSDEAMSLKRVVSGAQQANISARKSSLLSRNVDIAMKAPGRPRAKTPSVDANGQRRIASLSEMPGNLPRGGYNVAPITNFAAPLTTIKSGMGVIAHTSPGLGNGLKRSQSVKTGSGSGYSPAPVRKRSTALKDAPINFRKVSERGRRSSRDADEEDKENERLNVVREEDLVSASGLTGVESHVRAPAAGNGFSICKDSDVESTVPGSTLTSPTAEIYDEEEGADHTMTETATVDNTMSGSEGEDFEDATESYTADSRAGEDLMSEVGTEVIHRGEEDGEDEEYSNDGESGFRSGGGDDSVVYGTAGGLKV